MCTSLCVSVRSRSIGMSRSKLPHSTAGIQAVARCVCSSQPAVEPTEQSNATQTHTCEEVLGYWEEDTGGTATPTCGPTCLDQVQHADVLWYWTKRLGSVTWSSLLAFYYQGHATVSKEAPRSWYTSALRCRFPESAVDNITERRLLAVWYLGCILSIVRLYEGLSLGNGSVICEVIGLSSVTWRHVACSVNINV
jgi:hypothetical protein